MGGIGFIKRLLGTPAGEEWLQAAYGARMLVVDDSATICAVLEKMLRQQGYEVDHATDGATAMEKIFRWPTALVFLDVVMPGMNGFTVLRKLRNDPRTRDVPIVMISGNQQATEQFYLQRCGADDFMKKPFGHAEVCQRISQLVAAGRLDARHASVPLLLQPRHESTEAVTELAMPDEAANADLPSSLEAAAQERVAS